MEFLCIWYSMSSMDNVTLPDLHKNNPVLVSFTLSFSALRMFTSPPSNSRMLTLSSLIIVMI